MENSTYLQTIYILWVDKDNEIKKNDREKIIEKNFQGKIKTLYYTDASLCQNFIINSDANCKIFLITSGSYGCDLMKEVHDVEILNSVYVYCFNVEKHSKWAADFSKIICIEKDIKTILNVMTNRILLSLL